MASAARWGLRHYGRPNVNNYGVGDGPMANLLRLIRDAGDDHPTVSQLYERAVETDAGVRSRRHMKSLLNWMKKIQRVRTTTPSPDKPGKGKNWVFALTERGEKHIEAVDAAAGVDAGGGRGGMTRMMR